jgi:hypothetical protein
MKRPPTPHPGDARKPQVTLPAGWKEAPLKEFSVGTWQVADGGQTAVVTISPVGGELVSNILRWRMQVGLEAVDAAQVAKDVRGIEVDGDRGAFVDLAGPKGRILGVLVTHRGQPWVLKMTGGAELLGKEKTAFEAFAKSVRFE